MSVLDEYIVRLERRQRSKDTLTGVRVILNRFDAWCIENGIDPDHATPDDLETYFDELPFKDSTRRRHLVNVRAAYNYALRRGVVTMDPTIDVYIRPPAEKVPEVIPSDELKAMRDACPDARATLHFHLLAFTGMRRAELTTLPWDQVDLPNRTINVIGKGGKRRLIPIHPTLGEVLADNSALARSPWVFPGQNGSIDKSTSERILKSYCEKYAHHAFRRTVSSSLDANGVEEHVIEEIMGWAKRGIFARHYRFIAPERLHQAILRLYADAPL